MKEKFNVPVALYSVSGEYSMIKAGAKLGYINEEAIICESAVCMYRAGADLLISYFAREIAQYIKEGKIG
jgi:porphobilinogen synthase